MAAAPDASRTEHAAGATIGSGDDQDDLATARKDGRAVFDAFRISGSKFGSMFS